MMIYLSVSHVSRWLTIKLLLCVSLWPNISRMSLFRTTAFPLGAPSSVSYRPAASRHLGGLTAKSLSNPAKKSLSASSDSLSLEEEVLLCGLKKVHRRRMNPIASDTKRASWVERQASTIPGAGYGLIARKNIPAGTIVAYYPAHRLGVEYDTQEDEDGSVLISMTVDQEDQDYFETQAAGDAPSSSNYLHFLMGKRPLYHPDRTTVQAFDGGALFVDVNPHQPLVPGWMGHLVNDGATVASTAEQSILEYYAASRAAKNCVHIPFGPSPMLVTITTRKVKKGQELFTTYGCNYWIDALLGPAEMDTVEITPAIQDEVKETARDIFLALQGANTRRQSEAEDLQASFDTPWEG